MNFELNILLYNLDFWRLRLNLKGRRMNMSSQDTLPMDALDYSKSTAASAGYHAKGNSFLITGFRSILKSSWPASITWNLPGSSSLRILFFGGTHQDVPSYLKDGQMIRFSSNIYWQNQLSTSKASMWKFLGYSPSILNIRISMLI